MTENPWLQLLLATVLTMLTAAVLRPLAARTGFVDHPAERKIHSGSVPLVGGLAIFVCSVALAALTMALTRTLVVLWGAALLILLVGLIDDRWGLSPRARFAAQLAGGLLMVFGGGVQLHDFGQLLWPGTLGLGWLSIPVTLFCTLGVINAFNMIDGLDGLSGAIFIIAAGCMAFMAAQADCPEACQVLLLLAAATLGFLLLNARLPGRKRAWVFLGDSGAALLGFVLAWYFIDLSQGAGRAFAPVTALWLFAVPLLDTVFQMIKRIGGGLSPFEADREHLHHAFLRAGFTVNQTWLLIILLAVVLAGFGLLGELAGVPEYLRYYLFLLLSAGYYALMSRAWRNRRFLGRAIE